MAGARAVKKDRSDNCDAWNGEPGPLRPANAAQENEVDHADHEQIPGHPEKHFQKRGKSKGSAEPLHQPRGLRLVRSLPIPGHTTELAHDVLRCGWREPKRPEISGKFFAGSGW